jgi:beta-lactamase class A
MLDRRAFLGAGIAMLSSCGKLAGPTISHAGFEQIRSSLGPGARLGVAALDTGSGRRVAFHADERFAMASTFKLALAAAILKEADKGTLGLSEKVRFTGSDVLDYAPVVKASLDRGELSVEELCKAIVEVSDNSAANLLLDLIGGPPGLTLFIRKSGDGISRLDRREPALNENAPGDLRDTTSPNAMIGLMHALLVGDTLSTESQKRLGTWLRGSTTGLDRLRAGLPQNWISGDKTGTGANGAHNDIAIAWPPDRYPILIASYQSGGDAQSSVRATAHAAVARSVAAAFN